MAKRSTASKSSKKDQDYRFFSALLVVLPLAGVIYLVMTELGAGERSPQATLEVESEPDAPSQAAPSEIAEAPAEQPRAPEPEPEPEHAHHHEDHTLASAQSEFKPGDPSHPMSPERMRAYRQTYLIGQIDGAILVKDAAGIRRLTAEYRAEYPDDDEPTRQAYEMIADCLDNKTPELVERARTFWQTKRSSRARRDLRKICLE